MKISGDLYALGQSFELCGTRLGFLGTTPYFFVFGSSDVLVMAWSRRG